MTEDLTRRRLFGLAGATALGAAGLGVAGCGFGSAGSAATLATTDASDGPGFVTHPHFTPPQYSVRNYGLNDSKYIFLNAPYSGPGHGGTYIIDVHGHLVWFGPNTATEHRMDFNCQTYQGKPVLTWWEGLVVEGFGKGHGVIADSSYKQIATVSAVNTPGKPDIMVDLHEFNLTSRGTAFVTAYRTYHDASVNLSGVRGPATGGYLLSGVAQEIDIATGDLVHEWDSWKDGVALTETYEALGGGDGGYGTKAKPFNYFHINSIADWDEGHWLISGRNTWTVYLVNKASKQIVWRMHGKKNNFKLGPGVPFYWQHHVRPHSIVPNSGGLVTVFDNGAAPAKETNSRGLVLHVDTKAKTVTLHKQYTHPGVLAGAMGSAQLLSDGMFIGWGTVPRFSQYTADHKLLLDGTMIKGSPSYRAFTLPWTGTPAGLPLAAARHRTGGATVYASWNGSTEAHSWAVYAGKTAGSLAEVGTAPKTGFETAIEVKNTGPYFAVQALNAKGTALAKSAPVKIS